MRRTRGKVEGEKELGEKWRVKENLGCSGG